MKTKFIVVFLLICGSLHSQTTSEDTINNVIEYFFEGFHNRDTAQMRSVLSDHLHMQRIGKDSEGVPYLKDESVADFMTSIASLPDTLIIEERLHFYIIQTDGDMAHAWTPYSFYVQGELHHCGVNSFQLFNNGKSWKIIYIADTRQVASCTEPE